jgi:hypothetical protein
MTLTLPACPLSDGQQHGGSWPTHRRVGTTNEEGGRSRLCLSRQPKLGRTALGWADRPSNNTTSAERFIIPQCDGTHTNNYMQARRKVTEANHHVIIASQTPPFPSPSLASLPVCCLSSDILILYEIDRSIAHGYLLGDAWPSLADDDPAEELAFWRLRLVPPPPMIS